MKIMLVNGSPKSRNSGSSVIIKSLCQKLGNTNEYILVDSMKIGKEKWLKKISDINILVLVLPVYVDAIPSHLVRLLNESKHEIKELNSNLYVYGIANCGFYEGKQCHIALEMLEHFCNQTNLTWGQGLGIGAGGMLPAASVGNGPFKNLGDALDKIVVNIQTTSISDTLFINPSFPKISYKVGGNMQWRSLAKKNNLKRRDIYKQW